MTIARIAYLTSPDPGRFVLNYQPFGTDELTSVEITQDQIRNMIITGVSLVLSPNTQRINSRPSKGETSRP